MNQSKRPLYWVVFVLFVVYLYKVLDLTLFQFQWLLVMKLFNPNLMLNGQPPGEGLNLVPLLELTADDLKTSLLNVLLMVPLGLLLPFLTRLRGKGVALTGALFSLAIEAIQLISGLVAQMTFRIADVNDLIFNTVGTALGYGVFVAVRRLFRRLSSRQVSHE